MSDRFKWTDANRLPSAPPWEHQARLFDERTKTLLFQDENSALLITAAGRDILAQVLNVWARRNVQDPSAESPDLRRRLETAEARVELALAVLDRNEQHIASDVFRLLYNALNAEVE